MSEDRRLTAQGQERKQQLLDCAATLFAERGFAETRVLDVVRAAGVAKGLFYWYFENKEALYRELVEQNRLQLRKTQAAAIDPDAEPLLRLRQGAEVSVHYMARYAHFFSLNEVENVDKQLARELKRGADVHTADVAAIIRLGIEDGTIRTEDVDLAAYGTVATISYYSRLHRSGRYAGDLEDLATFVGRWVVCALASHEEIARRVLRHPAKNVAIPG